MTQSSEAGIIYSSVFHIDSPSGLPINEVWFKEGLTRADTRVRTIQITSSRADEPGDVAVVMSSLERSEYCSMKREDKRRPITLFVGKKEAETVARELLREVGKPVDDLEMRLRRTEESLAQKEEELQRLRKVAKRCIAQLHAAINSREAAVR